MLLSTSGYGASGFQNDADGNTLSGNGRTNTWDSQNRLVSCLINGNTTAYKYGADGLRRQSTKNGASTDYAYDATMLVREGHAAGGSLTASTVTATYFIGARGPEYRRDDTATEIDSQGNTVTKARWYVYDGLGSVVGEVDPLGNLTSSPKYDVYGAGRSNGGTATSKQGFVGSLGHVSDDTGLVYMRARYYDPSLGRFVSEDGEKIGSNWFAYCNGDPINWSDRTGCDPSLGGLISAIVDFAMALLNSTLEMKSPISPAQAINNLESSIRTLKGISTTAQLLGEDEIAEGTATEEGSAYLGPLAPLSMRAGEIQQGLGAKTMAYGVAAKLTTRMLEDMIEIIRDSAL